MNPLILPDRRGKATRITPELVRRIVKAAQEFKSSGKRLRIKSFTRQLAEQGIELSSKKVTEILIANDLYKASVRKRRPRFYQRLRGTIPNGLVSADGKEFTVLIGNVPYKFNLELSVDVESFFHSAFSISESETTEEFLKVLETHRASCGTPLAIVTDHGSANLSEEARAYLAQHDIEIFPAGPRNPKGNGSVESAFSGMEEVIGTIQLDTSSPQELARGVLEKIVAVYITMRNRLARLGTNDSPEEAMRTPISDEQQQRHKARYRKRAQKTYDPSRAAKCDRLHCLITHHHLVVDEQSLKRARKCIVSYDSEAITRSEEAFLKAIRKDEGRRTLPYFFGILKNIQNEMDAARYREYCQQRYNYQQMMDQARHDQEKDADQPTVEVLVETLKAATLSSVDYIKEMAVGQAKRMVLNLRKQFRYVGSLRRKIQEALDGIGDMTLAQRNEIIGLVDQFLT